MQLSTSEISELIKSRLEKMCIRDSLMGVRHECHGLLAGRYFR